MSNGEMTTPTNSEAWRIQAEGELATAKRESQTSRNWPIIYYHSGVAVEFILKAIRMKRDGLTIWPDEDKGAKWHNLEFIARRCSVLKDLASVSGQPALLANWLVVRDWSYEARYPGYALSEPDARGMLTAVASPTNGVMPWLQSLYRRS